jgi:hypothetical protein
MKNVNDPGSAESSYYTWIDQYDTFGLGKDIPVASGNLNDSLLALVDGKFVNLRVPYPVGFFTKWAEGRKEGMNDLGALAVPPKLFNSPQGLMSALVNVRRPGPAMARPVYFQQQKHLLTAGIAVVCHNPT